jgi:two-component system, chemotaxis family, response regulator Rcp1
MRRIRNILLVEDNPADAKLTAIVMDGFQTPHQLTVVRDGEEAMAYLRRRAPFAHVPRPDLVLLDLNLPRKDGREVLREVKSDPDLKSVPVVVLTTSGARADLEMAYELQANCFIQKPVDLESFRRVMAAIEAFWLRAVLLPPDDVPPG